MNEKKSTTPKKDEQKLSQNENQMKQQNDREKKQFSGTKFFGFECSKS